MLATILVGAMLNPILTATLDKVSVRVGDTTMSSPKEGLWSIATDWEAGWPTNWHHVNPVKLQTIGDWTIVQGQLSLAVGNLVLRDSYRLERGLVRCVRRFDWTGSKPLDKVTLSSRWFIPGASKAKPLLPGISYSGNPSGAKMGGCVPVQKMTEGEQSFYEEHRYPMPFASLEWADKGAALHTIPSMPSGGQHADQWWSLGLVTKQDGIELALLSGPCASNGQTSVVKARQGSFMAYPDTWLTLQPGSTVEKTFFLQPYAVSQAGAGFVQAVNASLDLFQPYGLDGLPPADEIVAAKAKFAQSRWRETDGAFEMYPDYVQGTHFVMGWCGQGEALCYAMLVLRDLLPDAEAKVRRSMDLLTSSPFNGRGFFQRYTVESRQWSEQDFVSQGQAMESLSRAYEIAKRKGIAQSAWATFIEKAAAFHATRILSSDWKPLSTNEGFLISPLLRSSRIFKNRDFERAALKAVDHYAARHLTMEEPYWGGTLDASCEDKEGAWAAFQGFLAAYEHTKQKKFLSWAEHAMYVALSYTYVWNVDLPAGRLKDHGFKTLGWTMVSAQNQHVDVFGVYYTPEIYKMGQLLKRPELQKLARVMYRSCGQLIDPYGSQGEQIQQTNFAQAGDMSNVFRLRGGYSEGWTVFWITTHFLHAAARFKEMGVTL